MATSPRNGKRRGSTVTSIEEGAPPVLAVRALAAKRRSPVELRPPSVLTPIEKSDARPKANGGLKQKKAPAKGKDGGGVAAPPNGTEVFGPNGASAQPRLNRALQGYIDEANASVIRGWAWDPTAPNERIRLELVQGDLRLLTVLAED